MKKNFFLLFLSVFLSLFFIEIILRYFNQKNLNPEYYNQKYTKKELDKKLPFRKKIHGGECVKPRFTKSMQWHSRIGWHDKDVDIECINNLFRENKLNIIFMGGSAMANYETPNYLTSIEHYLENNLSKEFRSVNFAESGARMSNNLNIFIEYIPKLKVKPNYIIFFDGYNEFLSIIYGGKPDNDFYFTATVKDRIHNPIFYLSLKTIEQSELLKIFFYKILKIKNNRIVKNKTVDNKKILAAAEDYIYRKKILTIMCKRYNIDCIFSLQPNFYISKNIKGAYHEKIKNYLDKISPNTASIIKNGYTILANDTKISYNLSDIFNNKDNIYFDEVHFNKEGARIVADNFKIILNKKN